MANQTGNGRNQSMSDEERSSWRPDEESLSTRDRDRDRDDERMYRDRYRDDERFMQRERERAASWDDRSSRGWDREDSRSGGWRSIERGGLGQSGYGAGREGDRSYRNPSYPSSFDERARDERYASGRGHEGGWGNEMGHGSQWDRDRQGLYGGYDRGREGGYGRTYEQSRYGYAQQQGYGPPQGDGPQRGYGQQGMQGGYGQHYGRGQYNPSPQEPSYRSSGEPGYGYGQPQRGEEYESFGQRIKGWLQGHRGKGPAGYMRSDERIRENVCEALSDDDRVDASNIEVTVKMGEVTLSGTVEDRLQKRLAEECIENISGVKDVQNLLRVTSMDVMRRGSTTTAGTTSEPEKTTSQNGTDKRGRA